MVDRAARDRLVELLRGYLNSEITSFVLDDALFEEDVLQSGDEVINYVQDIIWVSYSDTKDHKIAVSKEYWDLCQRLLLLLGSDAEMAVERNRYWSMSQLVALGCLIAGASCVYFLGWNLYVLATLLVMGGICSLCILRQQERFQPEWSASKKSVYPFMSLADLRKVYLGVRSFRKRQYPRELAVQTERSKFNEQMLGVQSFVGKMLEVFARFLLSPLVLLMQCFPVRDKVTRVLSAN